MRIILLFIALLSYGCGPDLGGNHERSEADTEINIGRVVDVKYVQESFATWAKTEIETDKGFFVLRGTVYVMKGDQVTMTVYTFDKMNYLCFSSSGECHKMWGSRN